MYIEWEVTTRVDHTYTFKSPDGKYDAMIHGDGKDWHWQAFYGPTGDYMTDHAEGDTVSLDSAKEDIRRWFAEVSTGG